MTDATEENVNNESEKRGYFGALGASRCFSSVMGLRGSEYPER